MDTIADYVSQKDEIEALKKKVRLLQVNNSIWKSKYEKLLGRKVKVKRVSRSSKAAELVKAWLSGDKSLTLNQIADRFFLSHSTVKTILHKVRRKAC